jgi:ribose/xylose/arabinose/galactoside ABC-type transport system permease subunit
MSHVRELLKRPEMSVFIPLILIMVFTSINAPAFLSRSNIFDLLRNISYTVIIATGMTYVVLSANLDLSLGSTLTFAGMTTGFCLVHGVPIFLSIIIAMFFAGLIGFLNGMMIIKLKISPVIATLGMQYICKGIVFVVSKGTPYYPFPDSFKVFGQAKFYGLSYSVFFAAVIIAVFHFILISTTFGRKLMALGGNREATRLAGISVNKMMVGVYTIAALLAGFVGILMASRMGSSMANAGDNKDLLIIAGVVIGGTSISGGAGNLLGTLIGVTLMEVLTNSLVMLRVSAYWQNVMIGGLMIFAVSVDFFRRNARPVLRAQKA